MNFNNPLSKPTGQPSLAPDYFPIEKLQNPKINNQFKLTGSP